MIQESERGEKKNIITMILCLLFDRIQTLTHYYIISTTTTHQKEMQKNQFKLKRKEQVIFCKKYG